MEILVEKSELGLLNQLGDVNTKLPAYISGGILNPDPAKVAQAVSDHAYLSWVLNADESVHEQAQAWAKYKRGLLYGLQDGLPLGAPPIAPAIPAAPTTVSEKLIQRTEKFYQAIARDPGFTQTIGEDLGIIKPESEINLENVLPVLKVRTATGGHPLLHVAKGHYDGYEVLKAIKGQSPEPGQPQQQSQSAQATAHFAKLDTSMRADYLDTTPLPSVSQVWIYRVQYVYKGQKVGLVSAPVEVAVFNMDLILQQ